MKNVIMLSVLSISVFSACRTTSNQAGSSEVLATKHNYCGDGIDNISAECKDIPGNRRDELGKLVAGGNPVALTLQNGNLFIHYVLSGNVLQKCQITSNVVDMKLSHHEKDTAAAYFLTSSDELHDVRVGGEVGRGLCPKANTRNMLAEVNLGKVHKDSTGKATWAIVSNGNSSMVGIALTTDGLLEWSVDQLHPSYDSFMSVYDSDDFQARLTALNAQ